VHGSGLITVIICGVLQGIYTVDNFSKEKLDVIHSTVRYVSFLARQMGSIAIGMTVPVFFHKKSVSF
jgi:hypothetical protein